jgi:hypothetical protein
LTIREIEAFDGEVAGLVEEADGVEGAGCVGEGAGRVGEGAGCVGEGVSLSASVTRAGELRNPLPHSTRTMIVGPRSPPSIAGSAR